MINTHIESFKKEAQTIHQSDVSEKYIASVIESAYYQGRIDESDKDRKVHVKQLKWEIALLIQSKD